MTRLERKGATIEIQGTTYPITVEAAGLVSDSVKAHLDANGLQTPASYGTDLLTTKHLIAIAEKNPEIRDEVFARFTGLEPKIPVTLEVPKGTVLEEVEVSGTSKQDRAVLKQVTQTLMEENFELAALSQEQAEAIVSLYAADGRLDKINEVSQQNQNKLTKTGEFVNGSEATKRLTAHLLANKSEFQLPEGVGPRKFATEAVRTLADAYQAAQPKMNFVIFQHDFIEGLSTDAIQRLGNGELKQELAEAATQTTLNNAVTREFMAIVNQVAENTPRIENLDSLTETQTETITL